MYVQNSKWNRAIKEKTNLGLCFAHIYYVHDINKIDEQTYILSTYKNVQSDPSYLKSENIQAYGTF